MSDADRGEERAQVGWRGWAALALAVFVLGSGALVAGSVPERAAASVGGTVDVDVRVDLEAVPDGTPLRVGFGADLARYDATADGDGASARGTMGITGALWAVDDDDRVRGLAIVPKDPDLDVGEVVVDERSTALGLLLLSPGWAPDDPLVAALVLGAAASTPEAERLAALIAAEGAADPGFLADPSPEIVAGVSELGAATEVVFAEAFGIDPPDALGAAYFQRRPLPRACEEGGGIVDLDGRESDGLCLEVVASGGAGDAVIEASNGTPRWVLVYTERNGGLLPDAVVGPKQWAIPAVTTVIVDLISDVVAEVVQEIVDAVRGLLRFVGITYERDDQTLIERFLARFASYNEDEVALFRLSDVGDGLDVDTVTAGIWRDGLDSPGRYAVATTLTVLTAVVLPALEIALDVQLRQIIDDPEVLTTMAEAAVELVVAIPTLTQTIGASGGPAATRWDAAAELFGLLLQYVAALAAHPVLATFLGTLFGDGFFAAYRGLIGRLAMELLGALATGGWSTAVRVIEQAPDYANASLGVIELALESWEFGVEDAYTVFGGDGTAAFEGGAAATATVIVLDTSGSMDDAVPGGSGRKIDAAQRAARDIAEVISVDSGAGGSHDLAVVAFNEIVWVPSPLRDAAAGLAPGVASIEPNGGTDIGAGLEEALGVLRGTAGTRSIVLLSDGEANHGRTQDQILSELVPRARNLDVRITSIGFAPVGSFDDSFLRSLAERTGGFSDVATTVDQLRKGFVRARHAATGEVVEEVSGVEQLADGAVVTTIDVDEGVSELVVSLVADQGEFVVRLVDPLGRLAQAGDGVIVESGNPATTLVRSPLAGEWQVAVEGEGSGRASLLVDAPRWRPPGAGSAGDTSSLGPAGPPGMPLAAGGTVLAQESSDRRTDDPVDFSMIASVRRGVVEAEERGEATRTAGLAVVALLALLALAVGLALPGRALRRAAVGVALALVTAVAGLWLVTTTWPAEGGATAGIVEELPP